MPVPFFVGLGQKDRKRLKDSVMKKAPLSDEITIAVSKLVDDALADKKREPSHSEIGFQIDRAELKRADPNRNGQVLGKAKRVRAILDWAIEHDQNAGEILVAGLISTVRSCGGFREASPNYG